MESEPMNGKNLLAFFKKLCQKARHIKGIDVLPSLCLRTKTLLSPYRFGLCTDEVIRSISSISELESFLSRSLLSTDVYQKIVPILNNGTNALFSLETNINVTSADYYYCTHCSCPKCKNASEHMKEGCCINCSCDKCVEFNKRRMNKEFKEIEKEKKSTSIDYQPNMRSIT